MDIKLEETAVVSNFSDSKRASAPGLCMHVSTINLSKILISELGQRVSCQNIYVAMIVFLWGFWGYEDAFVEPQEYASNGISNA